MGSSAPDRAPVPAIEVLLRRDRWVTSAGLVVLVLLAGAHTVAGAGMGMDAWQMTSLALFPHATGMAMAPTDWTPPYFALVVAMWWTMMVAMMTPTAAPTILLYARVHRQAQLRGQAAALAPTAPFAAGYLAIWGCLRCWRRRCSTRSNWPGWNRRWAWARRAAGCRPGC